MSEGSAGPIPTPEHWARVQLAQGQSSAGLWDLSTQLPEARVTVGSGPEAGWNVQGEGVAPVHFELYWDGSSLWVSPPMAGTLTVDGERVQQWRQLAGRCRVEFGRAAFMVESSQSIAVPGAVVSSAPAAAAPEAPADLSDYDDDDATFVYQEAPVADSVPPLQGDATQMVDPSGMAGRPALGGGARRRGRPKTIESPDNNNNNKRFRCN